MSDIFNIYCDESCHLEHDKQKVMVLGAVWCPSMKRLEIAQKIRGIKVKHGLPAHSEIKWVKVSNSKIEYYKSLIDYFFSEKDLHFRALVVPDKSILQHGHYEQDHDTWYYKMYYYLLRNILEPEIQYRIFLDIKDTRSMSKIHKLHDVLCNSKFDFNKEIIKTVQAVRSHEVEQIQLTDLMIGAVSYANRGLTGNPAKLALVNNIQKRTGYKLTISTLPMERKMNIFIWEPRDRRMA
jgi:hypothetical protein